MKDTQFYSKVSDGQPPYHPAMFLKVVLFGYMNNIFSTRGLEAAMKRDVHLIWFSSYQFPDHTTINRFKTRCMPYIKAIFSRLVLILVIAHINIIVVNQFIIYDIRYYLFCNLYALLR